MSFGNINAARNIQTESARVKPKKIPTYQQEVWTLIPEESVIVRFVGGSSEPHIFHQHGTARHPSRGFEKGICSKPDECILCQASSIPGEKRVKRASPYAAFTVYSTRKMLLSPIQRQDGTTGTRREPLRQNESGDYIRKNPDNGRTELVQNLSDLDREMEDEGLKVWCGSLHPKAANADQILALDSQLHKICQCGSKVGTGLKTRPAEIVENADGSLSCTAECGNPRRGSLTACYVQITRRGSGTDTTYTFRPLPFSEAQPEHRLESMDLKTIYKPDVSRNREMLEVRGITLGASSNENIWA